MTDRYRVEEVDVQSAPEDVLRARWAAVVELHEELFPEDPIAPFEQHRLELMNVPSHRKPRYFVAWDGDGRHALGYGDLELEYKDSNRHLAWFDVGVRTISRRQRIGTDLVAAMTEAARLDGRTVLGSASIDGHAGDDFAQSLGFEKRATERKSRLTVANVDRELMDRWVKSAETQATDYELVAYGEHTPEHLIDQMVDLYDVTNTAPRDDLDLEDEVMTAERLREGEANLDATNTKRWRLIARHVPTGRLAGFTDLFFAPYTDSVCWQGWTAVRPDHRNHGLGRWLKAANIIRLMEEKPTVEAVDTWNAFSNGPMLSINIAMGFELLRGVNDWQGPADAVAEAAKQRLGV